MALSNQLQRRRGTVEEHSKFTGADGEITVVTTQNIGKDENDKDIIKKIYGLAVHDGTHVGGYRIPTYTEMEDYIKIYKISTDNIPESLQNKIAEIDNKLNITKDSDGNIIGTAADHLYRHSDTTIVLGDLSDELQTKLNTATSGVETLRSELANSTDDDKGSSLIGFRAGSNFNKPTEIDTVSKAINALADSNTANSEVIKTVAGQIQGLNTAFTEVNSLAQTTANSFAGIKDEFNEYKGLLGNYQNDINTLSSAINLAEVNSNAYTDEKISIVNNSINNINTGLSNVYTKTEVNAIKTSLESVDTQLQNDLTSVTNRTSALETNFGNYYTKTQTDTNISTAVANLVNGSSEALDTLKELADALGNDANFATNITKELAGKASLTDFTTLNNHVMGYEGTDGNRINGLTDNLDTLTDRVTALDSLEEINGESDNYGRVTILERQVNGYESGTTHIRGVLDRLGTIEGTLGISSPQNNLKALENRIIALEDLVNKHAAKLQLYESTLKDVAFSGRYDDLLGTPIMPNGYYCGKNSFNSTQGRTIEVPTAYQTAGADYKVLISPSSNPNGMIGEVWITKRETSFTVYCSGETRTTNFDYVIFKP